MLLRMVAAGLILISGPIPELVKKAHPFRCELIEA